MHQLKKLAKPPTTHVLLKHKDGGDQLNLMTFNVEGLGGNIAYLTEVLEKVDIILLQEHWLFEYEAQKEFQDLLPNWNYSVVSTDTLEHVSNHNLLRGWGGSAVCWKADMNHTARTCITSTLQTRCVRHHGHTGTY